MNRILVQFTVTAQAIFFQVNFIKLVDQNKFNCFRSCIDRTTGRIAEWRIKEPGFFLSNLDRFLISGLAFPIPFCKFLNNVLIQVTCFVRTSQLE